MSRALSAAGAVACSVHSDDFTFAAIDGAIVARTGIARDAWCTADFWQRYLHPDDREAIERARRAARVGWKDVSVTFRVVGPVRAVALQLVAHRRADRSAGRQALDAYLLAAPGESGPGDESRAATRALEQTRRDLLRANQLAVAGELVGAITHDLRQPLTALQVNIDVAAQAVRASPSQTAVALEALADALEDGRKLRDSLQVLQNLVAHREPVRVSVSVGAIISEVARLVQSEANARQVQLRFVTEHGLPTLSADTTMLREALLSLVLDAVEHVTLADGMACVYVDAKPAAESRVEIAVAHRRAAQASEDEAWPVRVARVVAEAHDASVIVETTASAETVVRTIWPSEGANDAVRDAAM
jgi:signal transduction histidine kinase